MRWRIRTGQEKDPFRDRPHSIHGCFFDDCFYVDGGAHLIDRVVRAGESSLHDWPVYSGSLGKHGKRDGEAVHRAGRMCVVPCRDWMDRARDEVYLLLCSGVYLWLAFLGTLLQVLMKLMPPKAERLTTEHIKSRLQKYRLHAHRSKVRAEEGLS